MAKHIPLDPDSLSDERLANLAATMVFLLLGERALRLLIVKAVEFSVKPPAVPS